MGLTIFRWTFAATLAVIFMTSIYAYYRWRYEDGKRLRVVTPGKLYRSGQLSADGLDEAVSRFGIRTVLNLQNEAPDPTIKPGVSESEFLDSRGVKFVFLNVDLVKKWHAAEARPAAVARFIALMDNPDNFPMLIHCRAGLHRTGVLLALYRMEYEGWTRDEALRELKLHGFGRSACTARNDYIQQYVLFHEPRARRHNPPSTASMWETRSTP